MKYWIVIHSYESYGEHKDIIALPGKRDRKTGEFLKGQNGEVLPFSEKFQEIKKGDKFAYYCQAPKMMVIGIFEISDGPGFFATKWKDSPYQFKIQPIITPDETKYVLFDDLVNSLDLFKDTQGQKKERKAAAATLMGTVKELKKEDFEKIEKMYLKEEENNEISPKELTKKDSFHINMISTSHTLSNQYSVASFVGTPERNRVYDHLEDKFEIKEMRDIPLWMKEISQQIRTFKRIQNIDNIWFSEEPKKFFIPFAAFEHEKDGNLRTVMDHFIALDNTLKSNHRFEDIKPLYFIIAKDSKQVESYENKIEEHGEWKQFKEDHKFHIFPIDVVEKRTAQFLKMLNDHLRTVR